MAYNLRVLTDYLNITEDVSVGDLQSDSRKVVPGDVFIAVKGQELDGRKFIENAVMAGASVVIYENEDGYEYNNSNILTYGISCLSEKLPKIAATFYGEPSKQLKVIGVTGTNGKSSITYYIAQLLERLGHRCAVIGTVGNGFPGKFEATLNTTPGPIELQKLFCKFIALGAEYVAMEVSSHGIAQGRIDGVFFARTVFTNLSRDHLDFHKTLEDYFNCKKSFILNNASTPVVMNADDPMILEHLKNDIAIENRYLVGIAEDSMFRIVNQLAVGDGTRFDLCSKKKNILNVQVGLVGIFNVYNAVMALASVASFGFDSEKLAYELKHIRPLVGRMEIFRKGNSPLCLVDYAHTPDGLEKAITAAREHTNGKLFVVFGCGGDRDQGKRSQMGKIASKLADYSIITNDNPRTESPEFIVSQILQGVEGNAYLVIYDRKQAIEKAIDMAETGDTVLIAGKGHEDYQIIGKIKHYFSDQKIVQEKLGDA